MRTSSLQAAGISLNAPAIAGLVESFQNITGCGSARVSQRCVRCSLSFKKMWRYLLLSIASFITSYTSLHRTSPSCQPVNQSTNQSIMPRSISLSQEALSSHLPASLSTPSPRFATLTSENRPPPPTKPPARSRRSSTGAHPPPPEPRRRPGANNTVSSERAGPPDAMLHAALSAGQPTRHALEHVRAMDGATEWSAGGVSLRCACVGLFSSASDGCVTTGGTLTLLGREGGLVADEEWREEK